MKGEQKKINLFNFKGAIKDIITEGNKRQYILYILPLWQFSFVEIILSSLRSCLGWK